MEIALRNMLTKKYGYLVRSHAVDDHSSSNDVL